MELDQLRSAARGVRTVTIPATDGGGEIEFDIAGRGADERIPVVLLHGWTLDRRMWASQVEALSGRRVVIAIDRRGSGASRSVPDLSRESDDVAAVLDAVGLRAAAVVGMSQGGLVAADFALRHPARIAALVLQGARLGSVAAAAQADIPVSEYADLARSGRLEQMKTLWREHVLMRVYDASQQPAVDAMLEAYSAEDLVRRDSAAIEISDADLASLQVPALIAVGEFDSKLRRRVAQHLAKILPDARLVEFARAGHLCNMCASDAYNSKLEAFLDGVDQGLRARIS